MDRITDLTKSRVSRIVVNAATQFKGTNPYRQEPVSPKDRLYKYSQLTPEQLNFYAQHFGVEVIQRYVDDMERLKERYQQ